MQVQVKGQTEAFSHDHIGYQGEEAKSQVWVVIVLSLILAALITVQKHDEMPLSDMTPATIQEIEQSDWKNPERFEALAGSLVIAH